MKHKKIKVNRNFLKVNSTSFRLYVKGKPVYILATYCLRYPHQMSFLWNKMPYSLLTTPKTHAV